MTIKGWTAAALVGCWLIAGCYGMKPEMKEGQSHWLTACSSADDCGDGELCACGVCTIECSGEAACGTEGTCASADDHAACSEAPEAVCLQRCERDEDCGGAALECSDGACVAVIEEHEGPDEPDAAAPDAEEVDSSLPDDSLVCIDIQGDWAAQVQAFVDDEAYVTCESDLDCMCADAHVECSAGCQVVLNAGGQVALEEANLSFAADRCLDAEAASCPSLTPVCTTCAPICVNNRCIESGRTPCTSDLDCADGEVCHIDRTCTAIGVENKDGLATVLGDTIEGFWPSFIVSFEIRDNTLYWVAIRIIDPELEPMGAVQQAHVFAMSFESREPVHLAGPFRPSGMSMLEVSGDRVVYEDFDGIWSVPRDGGGEAVMLVATGDEHHAAWRMVSEGQLYYVPSAVRSQLRRVTVVSGFDELVVDGGEGAEVRGAAVDAESFYVELYGPEPSATTRLAKIERATGTETTLVPAFHDSERSELVTHQLGTMFLVEGMLISDRTSYYGIDAYSLATGEPTSIRDLDSNTALVSLAVEDGFVYHGRLGPARADGPWPSYIERVNIQSGAIDRYWTRSCTDLEVSEGHLYWAAGGRLVRTPL